MQYDGAFECLIVSLDSFYKPIDKTKVVIENYNFDHPEAIDFDLAFERLQSLLDGFQTKIPRYNFVTHSREAESDLAEPTDVILFEGIFSLYDDRIRNLMTYKIFVHCDGKVQICCFSFLFFQLHSCKF